MTSGTVSHRDATTEADVTGGEGDAADDAGSTPRRPARPRPGRRLGRRPGLPLVVLVAGTLAAAGLLTWFTRGLWFHGDDWDYLLTRGTVPGADLGLWQPHGDHWSTAVVLLNRALFAVFGLRDYTPWALVTVGLHVLACLALYAVTRRVGAGPWVATIVTLVLLFHGDASEAMLWDAAMNQTGAVVFGLLALLATGRAQLDGRRLLLVWALLVVSLTFSGTGVTMVALVTVFVALDRGLRDAARVAAVPAAAFLYWYVEVGSKGAPSALDPPSLYLKVPAYVWRGLTDAVENAFVVPGAGPVVLLVLVATPFLVRDHPRLRSLALAGLAAALLQLTLVGATRIALGPEYAGQGRYAYLTVLFLSPSLALVLATLGRLVSARRLVTAVACVALLGGYVLAGVESMRAYAEGARAVTAPWQERFLGVVAAVDAGERILTHHPGNLLNATVRPDLVVSPEIRAALPQRAATPRGRLEAESMWMVGVSSHEYRVPGPATVELTAGWSAGGTTTVVGCQTFDAVWSEPVLEIRSSAGTEIGVTSDATRVTTELSRGGLRGGERTWEPSGSQVFVATTAQDATLRVEFDAPGRYVVCGR